MMRALNVVDNGAIDPEHLPYCISEHKNLLQDGELHLKSIIEETDKEVMKGALNAAGGNALGEQPSCLG